MFAVMFMLSVFAVWIFAMFVLNNFKSWVITPTMYFKKWLYL